MGYSSTACLSKEQHHENKTACMLCHVRGPLSYRMPLSHLNTALQQVDEQHNENSYDQKAHQKAPVSARLE